MKNKTINVLDKGFIRVVDTMGDDSSIVQAARVSYGEGTKTVSTDTSLIRYLMRNYHSSPFEMVEIKLHIKAPIFVARQWLRHRTASVNEISARYSVVKDDYYMPTPEYLEAQGGQSVNNKQGSGEPLPVAIASFFWDGLKDISEEAYRQYEYRLMQGVSRELGRTILPVNFYTEFYWKIDLHNLFHFLRLRVDSHAQYEIRQYAQAILDIVKEWVPISYQAFLDYRLNAVTLSAMDVDVIQRKARGEKVFFENSGMTKREWEELNRKVFGNT